MPMGHPMGESAPPPGRRKLHRNVQRLTPARDQETRSNRLVSVRASIEMILMVRGSPGRTRRAWGSGATVGAGPVYSHVPPPTALKAVHRECHGVGRGWIRTYLQLTNSMEPDNTARTPPASNELRMKTPKFVVSGQNSTATAKARRLVRHFPAQPSADADRADIGCKPGAIVDIDHHGA